MTKPLPHKRTTRVMLSFALAATLAGCSALRPHSPPPAALESEVQVPGMPNVRVWGDEFSP